MKYEITGINPERTIKKYKIYKNGIKIIYQKGKNSYYLNNDIIKRQIDNIMLEQLNVHINNKNNYINSSKNYKLNRNMIISIIISLILFLLAISSSLILPVILNLTLSLISISIGIIPRIYYNKVINKKSQDMIKYKLYIQNNEILESHYSKTNKKESTSLINNLDKTSLKELKNMLLQIEKKEEELGCQKKLGGLK